MPPPLSALPSLTISRSFSPGDTGVALLITDTPGTPADSRGELLRVEQQNTPWGPRHPQFVVRSGSGSGNLGTGPAVQAWDTFAICPHNEPGQVLPVGSCMLGVFTDESGDAPMLAMMNNQHHVPFAEMRDNAVDGTWQNGITRFKLFADGTLACSQLTLSPEHTPASSSEPNYPGAICRDSDYLRLGFNRQTQ